MKNSNRVQHSRHSNGGIYSGGICGGGGVLTLNIILLEANNHDPQILFRYIPNQTARLSGVRKEARKGVQDGKITATDEDGGDNAVITYDLISDWGNKVFSLNPSTGIFTLTLELDFETKEHYWFVVSGLDNGEPRLSFTVTV